MTISAIPSEVGDESAWRLPRDLSPVRYEIRLAPDVAASRFSGAVRIECDVVNETSEVVLNAAELEIEHSEVTLDGRPVPVSDVTIDEPGERVYVRLAQSVPEGTKVFVELRFSGDLNDRLRGFYRSRFVPVGGSPESTETIATTHFEPTDARRAFPCFDEPDLKAVFGITVDVPEGLGVWSNWSVASTEPLEGGARRVVFGDTMKMSTYLVCVVVGPLSATEPEDVDGTPVSVVCVPGKEHLTSFAVEAAAHSVRFFTEWFGIPYPGAKLDMIALPDFAMGAMENLGCVTFRESALLVDREHASLAEMQRVAQVVEHEIAHMWFGDLVTMRWWDGIWLNEAFATFMEISCGDDFRPEWDLWTNFAPKRELAMAIDGLHTTRPVEYPVGAPEEAEGMFDPLTYEKGAGLLRMLELFVGRDEFRNGIRDYLKTHSYANTDTEDLWAALERSSGKPVGEIMDTWLHQGGFPYVHVQVQQSPSGTGSQVALSQHPFVYSAVDDTTSSIGSLWKVPTLLRTVGGHKTGGPSHDEEFQKALLESGDMVVEVEGSGPPVVNAGGSGVYRVKYEPEHLVNLSKRWPDLDTLERFYLLSDTWAGVIAGDSSLSDFVALTPSVRAERDADVWTQVTTPLAFLDKAVPDSVRGSVASFTRALVGPVFAELGWSSRSDESERVQSLRSLLLGSLGTVGADPEVRAECARLHGEFASGGAALDPQLAAAIVQTVAVCGGVAEYETFLERYRKAVNPQEETRYLHSLALFEDPALVARTFDLALGEVRVQNAPLLIAYLLNNRVTGEASWRRVADRWDEITSKFPGTLVTRMLEGARSLCRSPELADEVRDFLAVHPVPAGQRSVDQTAERLGVNAAFAARLSGAGEVLEQAAASLGS